MNAAEIASYINNEVGMDIARIDDYNGVVINAERDFFGNAVYFNDYLICSHLTNPYLSP